MRFNFSIGPADRRLVEVEVLGHVAHVSIWMRSHVKAAESRYLLQFGDTWDQKSDRAKCEDAVRVAIADALAGQFAPNRIELVVEQSRGRWGGRLDALV
ncbi:MULTISPECIES: hypothetical protein [unclassified Duganella]|uniref:hypothetical protein n=1 Tax=unclassified Duganella TaxID=2636909 RepID=UPI00087501F5|nr:MULTISPECIES: hypothetical protein [unclassified Duganella]